MRPYDGVEYRYHHVTTPPADGREVVARVPGLPEPPAGELLYDLSLYSGGIGVLDRLAISFPAASGLRARVAAKARGRTPEEASASEGWVPNLTWLLAGGEDRVDLRPAADPGWRISAPDGPAESAIKEAQLPGRLGMSSNGPTHRRMTPATEHCRPRPRRGDVELSYRVPPRSGARPGFGGDHRIFSRRLAEHKGHLLAPAGPPRHTRGHGPGARPLRGPRPSPAPVATAAARRPRPFGCCPPCRDGRSGLPFWHGPQGPGLTACPRPPGRAYCGHGAQAGHRRVGRAGAGCRSRLRFLAAPAAPVPSNV